SDSIKYATYFKGMLQKGILLPPAQFEAMFLSTEHTDVDLTRTIKAHLEVLRNL
ncbi:MAG: aspartate aminotransferase family protein, partial [Vallitaleaceae bacterium]|nr:aspartate aminotransferase family protein [Vallitaleaceae bacterium]